MHLASPGLLFEQSQYHLATSKSAAAFHKLTVFDESRQQNIGELAMALELSRLTAYCSRKYMRPG